MIPVDRSRSSATHAMTHNRWPSKPNVISLYYSLIETFKTNWNKLLFCDNRSVMKDSCNVKLLVSAAVTCEWCAVTQQAASVCCPWLKVLWHRCHSGRPMILRPGSQPSLTGTHSWFILVKLHHISNEYFQGWPNLFIDRSSHFYFGLHFFLFSFT